MLTRNGRYMAAVLACGDGAVVSHRAAGALWELRSSPSGPVDVTIPRRGIKNRPGIRTHSSRRLLPDDTDEIDRIPCTNVARTLVDLAAVETPQALARAVEKALILRIFDALALNAQLARASGCKGAGTLRRVISEIADEPPPTSNDFERDFLFLVDEENLSRPIVNGWVCGYQVDFHWPDAMLIVETDGRATHDTAIAFERDRQRDLDLELAGWHVVRISWRQLNDEPARVAALLRVKLDGPPARYAGGGTGSAVAAAASMRPHP
ncbi:MAG: hypothetical protein QOI98_1656 [Solirubrobacteraceae bacterium]|nr:hypothetical protein [Solirubrobacteraceae bacterium]